MSRSRSYVWYERHAREVAASYESLDAEKLQDWLQDFLPAKGGRVLDVGAGSGRDAAWLVHRGHQVVAVEPSPAMRVEASKHHGSLNIQWEDERLPDMPRASSQGPYDLILLSAVWMHVAQVQRKRAFRKLINLLAPDGTLAITLRKGPEIPERGIHEVTAEELESLSYDHGAVVVHRDECSDQQEREDVHWTRVAIRFPDDGTGTLPLLRNIILRQNKSATHKLALLRTLCRIADSSAGIGRVEEDGTVSIPMGLVALTWIRLFMPLLAGNYPQRPSKVGTQRLGFVKQAFRKLQGLSYLDFRMGIRFQGEQGAALHQALKDAAVNIKKMPVEHMTYPNGGPILEVVKTGRQMRPREILLNEGYLSGFGEMRVPLDLWQTLRKHTIWVEPAVMSEWSRMIQKYAKRQEKELDESQIKQAMVWVEPGRDVQIPKQQALKLLKKGKLFCVWTGQHLDKASLLDMDHCLPWSVWSCGDLWNLMPAQRKVNQNKKGICCRVIPRWTKPRRGFWTGGTGRTIARPGCRSSFFWRLPQACQASRQAITRWRQYSSRSARSVPSSGVTSKHLNGTGEGVVPYLSKHRTTNLFSSSWHRSAPSLPR